MPLLCEAPLDPRCPGSWLAHEAVGSAANAQPQPWSHIPRGPIQGTVRLLTHSFFQYGLREAVMF